MTYDEGVKALDEFQDAHPWVTLPGMAHGVNVLMRDGEPVIEVVIDTDADPSDFRRLPASFGVKAGPRSRDLKVVVVPGRRCLPRGAKHGLVADEEGADHRPALVDNLVRAGDRARGAGMRGIGTAGWILYLDVGDGREHLLCMSNWHVLCARGNDSQVGVQRCSLKGRDVSTLFSFELISGTNRWDLAFAELDSPDVAAPEFVACADGNRHPYPADLTDPGKVVFESAVHKVGYSTGCTTGRLLGVGNTEVTGQGWFVNQLIFNRELTAPGDSGSVIVLSEDNSVLALHMSKNDRYGYGNPIYQAPWSLRGLRHVGNGQFFPEFTGPAVFTPQGVAKSPRRAAELPPYEADEATLEQFPALGVRYVVGVTRSLRKPEFDGTVELLGLDYSNPNFDPPGVWLLSAGRGAAGARRIRGADRLDRPLQGPGHYRPGPGEICFWTSNGWSGYGTRIHTCDVDDASGAVCLGVGVKVDGRWTIGPPPAAGLRVASIQVSSYLQRTSGRTGTIEVERFLFFGFN